MANITKSNVVELIQPDSRSLPFARLEDCTPLNLQGFPNPPKGSSKLLPQTIPNLGHILNEYGVTVRYNLIKKKIEINLPQAMTPIDNGDNVSLTVIISLAALNGFAPVQVPTYVEALAEMNPYNPVKLWIESKAWDGRSRIEDIIETITTREDFPVELKRALLFRWLLSCTAAALKEEGFKARGVLTLQGPQGCGKTTWVTKLVSDIQLATQVIRADLHLDPSNKDSIITAITHWIAEIGELDSSLRKDVARLKGFLTREQDNLRRPYAKGESKYGRRTVFCATVNAFDFLVDRTGNTRWWTLPVEKINYQHSIDTQQLFAELATHYHSGEQWWLTKEEEMLLEQCNRDHQSISAIQEILMEYLDLNLKGDEKNKNMSNREILSMIGMDKPTNTQFKESAAILRDLIGEPTKINGTLKWRIPLKRDGASYGGLAEQIEAIEADLESKPPKPLVAALLKPPRN